MTPSDDGGPAFPFNIAYGDGSSVQAIGMTLRDYFIAHAPAKPWPEFAPVMPPKPAFPDKHLLLSDEDRRDWDNERLDYDEEGCSEALRQFASANVAAWHAQDEWNSDYNLQRRIQWPAYWADQMLKARTA